MRPSDLVHAIGVQIFPATPPATIAAQLKHVGITLVRSTTPHPADVTFLQQVQAECAKQGIKLRLNDLIDAYANDLTATLSEQEPLLLQVYQTGMLESVEGPNEMDNPGVGGGTLMPNSNSGVGSPTGPNFLAWAIAEGWVRQNLPGVLLYSASDISTAAGIQADAANVSQYVDAGALHPYQPSDSQPMAGSTDLRHRFAAVIMGDPDGAVVATEFGYSNHSETQQDYIVDLVTGAKLNLNHLLDLIYLGFRRVMYYCLSGVDSADLGTAEGHFGLFDAAGSAKPTADAFARLISLCGYDDGQGKPGTLAASASDGAYVMAFPDALGGGVVTVWNETPVWDGSKAVTPEAVSCDVSWGEPMAYRVIDLITGVVLVDAGSGTGCTVQLSGYALGIKLSASTAAAPPASPPIPPPAAPPIAPPITPAAPPTPPPATVTVGADAMGQITIKNTGSDPLTLAPGASLVCSFSTVKPIYVLLSEDAYQGDAVAQVTVDQQPAFEVTVTAAHGKGSQGVLLPNADSSAAHEVTVTFTNDKYDGTPQTDRNLYVDGYQVGDAAPVAAVAAPLMSNGSTTTFTIPAAT